MTLVKPAQTYRCVQDMIVMTLVKPAQTIDVCVCKTFMHSCYDAINGLVVTKLDKPERIKTFTHGRYDD